MFFSFPSLRKRTAIGPYNYHTGDVFLPGAGNAVFEPRTTLPIIQLIGHAIYAGQLHVLQPPQIIVGQVATIAGIGGVVAGQFMTQPLNVPDIPDGNQ